MLILDTNLWVFGTLDANDRAVTLPDEIERGDTRSAINAYIVQEALDAFERTPGLTPPECDELQTLFLTRLTRMDGLVEAPTSSDVTEELLHEERATLRTQLLGQVLEIQPKDVPVLVLAYKYRSEEPTILTNDESFASFETSEHNLSAVSIEYVE